MDFNLTPTKLIDQLRAWFHPKDRSVFIAEDCFIDMDEQAKPSTNPAVGRDRLYPKSGNNWYILDSNGTETLLGGGGGLPVHDHSDNTQGGQNLHSVLELEFDADTSLTINAGAVTRTQVYHNIDTQAAAATDDLDTVSGGTEADILFTRQTDDARNVKYTTNGNLKIPSGIDLYSDLSTHLLGWLFDGQNWLNFANPFGRWSLIAETTLGASAASVTFASIPVTYRHLMMYINARTDRVNTADVASWQANADAGNNYDYDQIVGQNAGVTSSTTPGAASCLMLQVTGASATANNFGGGFILWPNYTNTNFRKLSLALSYNSADQTAANIQLVFRGGHWRNTAAITQLVILPNTGPNFVANSIFQLYGIL